jgi:nitrogen fixation NifU-like protein
MLQHNTAASAFDPEMESVYKEAILELYRNPLHHGTISSPTHQSSQTNPMCGDALTIQLLVDDAGTIVEAKHDGEGCAISRAGVSLLLDAIIGKTVEDVAALSEQDIEALLGIPISHTRKKCAMIGLRTLQSALHSPVV